MNVAWPILAEVKRMQYHEFLKRVQYCGGFSSQDEALQATRATLEALAERLNGGEANDLFAQLPQELVQSLRPVNMEWNSEADLPAFLERVAERGGVSVETARLDAEAVITVLRESVMGDEIQDVTAQLPPEIASLFHACGRDHPGSEGNNHTTCLPVPQPHSRVER